MTLFPSPITWFLTVTAHGFMKTELYSNAKCIVWFELFFCTLQFVVLHNKRVFQATICPQIKHLLSSIDNWQVEFQAVPHLVKLSYRYCKNRLNMFVVSGGTLIEWETHAYTHIWLMLPWHPRGGSRPLSHLPLPRKPLSQQWHLSRF